MEGYCGDDDEIGLRLSGARVPRRYYFQQNLPIDYSQHLQYQRDEKAKHRCHSRMILDVFFVHLDNGEVEQQEGSNHEPEPQYCSLNSHHCFGNRGLTHVLPDDFLRLGYFISNQVHFEGIVPKNLHYVKPQFAAFIDLKSLPYRIPLLGRVKHDDGPPVVNSDLLLLELLSLFEQDAVLGKVDDKLLHLLAPVRGDRVLDILNLEVQVK